MLYINNYRTGQRRIFKSLADDHVFELDIREYDAVEQIMKTYQLVLCYSFRALVSVAESVETYLISRNKRRSGYIKYFENH